MTQHQRDDHNEKSDARRDQRRDTHDDQHGDAYEACMRKLEHRGATEFVTATDLRNVLDVLCHGGEGEPFSPEVSDPKTAESEPGKTAESKPKK